jgi:hypothetical protein
MVTAWDSWRFRPGFYLQAGLLFAAIHVSSSRMIAWLWLSFKPVPGRVLAAGTAVRRVVYLLWVLAAVIVQHAHEPIPPAGDLDRLTQAGPLIREFVERFGHQFAPTDQQILRTSAQELVAAGWYRQTNHAALDDLSISICQLALTRIERVLQSASLERLSADAAAPTRRLAREWPSGKGVLLVRLDGQGPEAETTPVFIRSAIDLGAAGGSFQLQVPRARTIYAIVYASNASAGAKPHAIEFTAGHEPVARLELTVQVPSAGELEATVVEDASGERTPAVIGLYAPDHQLMVPPQAVTLDFWQNGGPALNARPYGTSRYWPGSSWEREVCFVDGHFRMSLPEGEYQLVVGKGPEYQPERQTLRVRAGQLARVQVSLRRWIDMPARGWVSGDGHVHFSRRDERANRPLMTWIQAEDVHIANVLRMGDTSNTYFEQYAFGPAGRVTQGAYSLVSGQEDPRTDDLGHVLGLNLKEPVRFEAEYHLYDLFLDQIRAQGGLAGYAHVYQPPRPAFWVRRDMTLNIVKGKADFLEVAEFGDADDRLYHEFLNLGFQLTATAGSDVPWGDSVGISRTYAYTGGSTEPDAWFRAVKGGHTFVTAGPMLMLTVNGQFPGATIHAKPGDKLQIKATAEGWIAMPQFLEAVAQGEVIACAQRSETHVRELQLELEFTVKDSTWITARCAGALTSPVYVRVHDEPCWKKEIVPELVRIRLDQLREIEAFAAQVEKDAKPGYGEREKKQMPALRERVAASKALYLKILSQISERRK